MASKLTETVAAFAIAGATTVALLNMAACQEAHADPALSPYDVDYCTPDFPYPPYGQICIGYNDSCPIGMSICSPIPYQPGTWNPGGYTAPTWTPHQQHQNPPGIRSMG